jgi:hypothetical protein
MVAVSGMTAVVGCAAVPQILFVSEFNVDPLIASYSRPQARTNAPDALFTELSFYSRL